MYHSLSSIASPGQLAAAEFAPGRVVRRVMDHVLALPAAALHPGAPAPAPAPPDTSAFDQRFQMLEDEVQELRRQVEFLEELLRERHEPALGAGQRNALPSHGTPTL